METGSTEAETPAAKPRNHGEAYLAFRPIGFTVAKAGDGFTLTLRCVGRDDMRDITNISLHCPFWWGRVVDMMSEAIHKLRP